MSSRRLNFYAACAGVITCSPETAGGPDNPADPRSASMFLSMVLLTPEATDDRPTEVDGLRSAAWRSVEVLSNQSQLLEAPAAAFCNTEVPTPMPSRDDEEARSQL